MASRKKPGETDGMRMLNLSHGGDRSHRSLGSRNAANIDFRGNLAVGVLLGAVARDMAGLTALIASLAGSVQRAAIGSGTVAGNVTEFTTSIALHSLSLAITGIVVGTTTLVACGRTRAASESTSSSKTTAIAATSHRGTAAHGTNRVGAGTLNIQHVSKLRWYNLSSARHVQQGGQAGHSYNIARRCHCR
jgi:hypothetical protein